MQCFLQLVLAFQKKFFPVLVSRKAPFPWPVLFIFKFRVLTQHATNQPRVECRRVRWQNWRTKFNISTWQCSWNMVVETQQGLKNSYDILETRIRSSKQYEGPTFLISVMKNPILLILVLIAVFYTYRVFVLFLFSVFFFFFFGKQEEKITEDKVVRFTTTSTTVCNNFLRLQYFLRNAAFIWQTNRNGTLYKKLKMALNSWEML